MEEWEKWKTHDEAIEIICRMLGCSKEEAEVILQEFKDDKPSAIKEVWFQ